MRQLIRIKYLTVLMLFMALFTACSDEVPVSVSGIYVQKVGDTTTELQEVRLGEGIRIEGSGFATTKIIYCNGVEVKGINRNLITDTNIILTIPTTTPIGPEVKNTADLNTIRIVTEYDNFVYNIKILGGVPEITSVSHTLPKAGDIIYIYGKNLRGLDRIIFPGDIEVTAGNFTESSDYTTLTVTVPEGGDRTPGAICVEGISGGAYSYDYMNRTDGIFLSSFDGQANDKFISFDSGAKLGSGVFDVNPDNNLPASPENYCMIPQEPTTLDPAPYVQSGLTIGTVSFDAHGALNSIANDENQDITSESLCNELAFQFDYYMTSPWSAGAFRIQLNSSDNNTRQSIITWVSNSEIVPVTINGWSTLTIPCSYFSSMKGKTLGEVINETPVNKGFFRFLLGRFSPLGSSSTYSGTAMTNCQIFAGNVRLVTYKKPEYINE